MRTTIFLPVIFGSLLLLGAGCAPQKQAVTPQPVPAAPAPSAPPLSGRNGGAIGTAIPADFPRDLPLYPNGRVVAATKFGTNSTLAQFTGASPANAIVWIKQQFQSIGATLESETLGTGNQSSNLLYKKGNATYSVRVDITGDGKAYLTMIRDEK